LALRAREKWAEIGVRHPDIGFRANGSLTLVRTPAELAVLEQVVARDDAEARGIALLTADAARRVNPALAGEYLAALHCSTDAVVEPREVLAPLRATCLASGRYRWLPGREMVGFSDHEVTDATGERHRGDRVVLCTGAAHGGILAEALSGAPVRRVRLEMLETEPFEGRLTTSLADGDSLRYYPAFDVPARRALGPQSSVAALWAAQLLAVQRHDGGLTIGDTHSTEEPFAFDVDEAPYRHLLDVAATLFGRSIPPIVRRWAGVYSQVTEAAGDAIYLRHWVAAGVEVVTGAGGRGMTLSPAIAEETFQ
jgi:FAD dependent oxidoreductase TIGR03364